MFPILIMGSFLHKKILKIQKKVDSISPPTFFLKKTVRLFLIQYYSAKVDFPITFT